MQRNSKKKVPRAASVSFAVLESIFCAIGVPLSLIIIPIEFWVILCLSIGFLNYLDQRIIDPFSQRNTL